MTLQEFEQELRARLSKPSIQRPFVCVGNPLECKVFIVGTNPATEMSSSFWSFWNSESGFDKVKWFAEYKRERQACPLKPGKTRRNEVSTTRKYIDLVVSSCYPIACLETNVFSYPAEEVKDLTVLQRSTKVFDWLVETVHPTVVLAAGEFAIEHLKRMTGTHLVMDDVVHAAISGHKTAVLAKGHFSSRRGDWSNEKANEVGQQIKCLAS